MADSETRSRSHRARRHIRQILQDAEEPLTARQIIERIDAPVRNALTAISVGGQCAGMDEVRKASRGGTATWEWAGES